METTEKEVSLLMEQNFTDETIEKTVAWCTDGGSDNTTCKNINTTGSDAPEGKDYIGHITRVFNKKGITVSFPTKGQMEEIGCTTSTGSCPTWAYDYLNGTSNPVSGVLAYWTVSPNGGNSILAWIVDSDGHVYNGHVRRALDNGLRPVITISKSSLN